MKVKSWMLITFVLLAILTIGAASAADDVASDDLAVSDDVDIIANETPTDDGGDDGTDDGEEEDGGMLYIEDNGDPIIDTEIVGLDTGKKMDTGRLVVFDNVTKVEYFNQSLKDMRYNTDWMKYKFNEYNGYYIFLEDLKNIETSGEYIINATYYDDDYNIIESLTETVLLDFGTFMIEDEIDVNNETDIIGVTIFEMYRGGVISIGYWIEDENEDMEFVSLYDFPVTDEKVKTVVRLNIDDLNLAVGYYEQVSIIYNLDEEDEMSIIEGNLNIVDNSEFRAHIDEDVASILYQKDLFHVYCPASSANTNITIKVNDKKVLTHLITADEAGNYIGFNLTELNISDIDDYSFDILDDDGEKLIDTYNYSFENPIEIFELCVDGSDEDSIAEFRVPEGFDKGKLVVKDAEDNELFSSDLSDMEPNSFGWDKGFMVYEINIDDLSPKPVAGIHTFTVAYIGDITITEIGEVRIVETKHVENDNVSINIFDYDIFNLFDIDDEDPDVVATVVADNKDGYVFVKVGDDWNCTYDEPEDDEGQSVYHITVMDFNDFDDGVYPITVSYFDADGNEVLNLTSQITFVTYTASVAIGATNIIMKEDWKNDVFITVRALADFDGSLEIEFGNFRDILDLVDFESVPDAGNEGYVFYYITYSNVTDDYDEGEYELSIEVLDGDEIVTDLFENINFYNQQINGNENVTIEIDPTPAIIPNYPFIFINATDDSGNVTVYVGDSDDPINISLSECWNEEVGLYVIGADKLNIGVGEYTLNVTYQNVSLKGKVRLVSNLGIVLMNYETSYYGYGNDPIIVLFTLREGDMEENPISGNVTVLVYIDGENPTVCYKGDIGDVDWYGHMGARGIRLSELEGCSDLSGTYKIEILYDGSDAAETGNDGEFTFKELEVDDFGVNIDGDRIILSSPVDFGEIIITIDGEELDPIGLWDMDYDEYENVRFVEIEKLADGAHQVTVSYRSFDYEESDMLELLNDVVNPIDPELSISIANITEGANAVIAIKTVADFSGNVSVIIGNDTYTVSVIDGTGSLPVAGLAVGSYNATAIFEAVDLYDKTVDTTSFTVNPKVKTVISATAVTTTYATSKNIVVTLKDANGNVLANKAITIVLNGVTKTLTTDAKGQVSLPIGTNLVPKKYDATIKFAGDDAYAASTSTVKVTVNKAKAKMTAKKKTFKAKTKTKKYTIVLKTDKNKALKKVKVTLKIKGKKYTVKTNAKGKATFKIKKLTKKGKYKATVTFAGNKYYNKVTKKVKITVK